MLETGLLIKVFGLGVVGSIGTALLNKAGKTEIAVVMDILLVIIAFAIAFKFVWGKLFDMLRMFGL